MEENLLVLLGRKRQQQEQTMLAAINQDTANFGLSLTEQEAAELIMSRNTSLSRHQRIEFGSGILDKLIFTFCDSQYIEQDTYLETLEQLADIFYEAKQASDEKLTDEELLTFMKEQFETVCYGDLEYLEDTCLARFTKAIRSGYQGHRRSQGKGEYETLSEEARWDPNTYYEILKELFW